MSMSEKLDNEKSIARKKFWDRFTYVLLAIYLALSAVFSISLIYQKVYFKLTWVNGQSMYPTFNENAVSAADTPKGVNGGDAVGGDKNFDLVITDNHEESYRKMERFDIFIFRSPYDEEKTLIKRLIVMPGETFYFGQTEEDYGELYLADENGEFQLVEQPISDEFIHRGDYELFTEPRTLGKDEYVFLGDNRGASTDSRNFGPIEKSLLKGIVVAVVGKCDAISVPDDKGLMKVVYTNIRYSLPRFIK